MGVGGRPGRVGSHRLPLRHLELGWRPRQWKEMAMGEKGVLKKKKKTYIYLFFTSHHAMRKSSSDCEKTLSKRNSAILLSGSRMAEKISNIGNTSFSLECWRWPSYDRRCVWRGGGCKSEWKMSFWLSADSAEVVESCSPASAAALTPGTNSEAPCTPDSQRGAPLPTHTPVHSTH